MVSFLGIGIIVFRAWFLSIAISGAVWGKKLFSTPFLIQVNSCTVLGLGSSCVVPAGVPGPMTRQTNIGRQKTALVISCFRMSPASCQTRPNSGRLVQSVGLLPGLLQAL